MLTHHHMGSSLEVEGRYEAPWEDEILDLGLEGSVAVHCTRWGAGTEDKQPRQRRWHCACVSVPACVCAHTEG